MRLIIVVWYSMLLLPLPARAESIDWLYEVRVPVETRTQADAEQALGHAFDVLLMRLTGSTSITNSRLITSNEGNPSTHLNHYEFETGVDEAGNSIDVVVVYFIRDSVETFLREHRLPLWPADRPTILLWMAIQDQQEFHYIGNDSAAGFKVDKRAQERGVEIMLPILDVDELAILTPASISGKFWFDIHELSQRYSPNLIVAVHCERNIVENFRATFTIWYGDDEHTSSLPLHENDSIEQQIVDYVVDYLADQHTIYREEEKVFRIQISNVATVQIYADILQTVDSFDFVDRSEVVAYERNSLLLDLYTPTSEELLVRLISNYEQLEPTSVDDTHQSDTVSQNYTWIVAE